VAHQAAHILNGDCFHATLISSIFEFYTAPFNRVKSNQFYRLKHEFEWDDDIVWFVRVGGQFFRVPFIAFYLFVILTLIFFTVILSTLMRMFISREAKLRADALAVQLTRNPISLAQAISILANQWRGAGVTWDGLEGVFMVNPCLDKMDEEEGFGADLFSTHPPIQKRLRVLLGMAHVDEKQFITEMQRSDEADNIVPDEESFPLGKWFLQNEKQWYGPFTLIEIGGVEWLRPDTLVKVKGSDQIISAKDDPELKYVAANKFKPTSGLCPACSIALKAYDYEGLTISYCDNCQGKLLNEDQVGMALNRKREIFSEDVLLIARSVMDQGNLLDIKKDFSIKRRESFLCPNCCNQKNRMITRFFNPMYPVVIDKCNACGCVWFEKNELEVLQAIFEKNTLP
jgi:Zn-finger nucleic acid-binding protein